MAGVSFGGLASGIDTQSIIDQLIAVERQPETKMKLRESALQARQATLTDVAGRLRNLLTAAKDLGSVDTWANVQTLEVSDSAKVSATRLSGAAPGGHDIVVSNLARAEQRSYAFTQGAATLNLGPDTHVSLTADDDGQAAADKINATASSPFYAVWVKDPDGVAAKDRLILSRKDTGYFDPATLTVDGAGWTSTEAVTDGVDASFTVDGALKSSRSNVLTNTIPGLQLTLKATGTTSVTVSAPGPDNDAVTAKVQAFVDQYNSTVDFIRGKLSEKRVPNATSDTDARKGVLFADTQLTGMLSQLRNLVSDKTGIGGAIASFGAIGVSTGAGSGGKSDDDALAGKLTLDKTKLTDALHTNRLDLKAFLTDPTNGVAKKLTNLLDPVAKSGGLVDLRAGQAGDEADDIEDQISRMEDRITQKQQMLQAQFTAMEQALSQSQSQSSWLSAQLR